MKKVRHVSLTRRAFLRKSAAAAFGLLATACVAAPGPATQPSGSVSAPASTTAPAVVRPSVAKNDFEAKYEELGRQWEGTTLRVPVGGSGHWKVNEQASQRFTELTGIKTIWEDNPYEQVYDKTFLDLASQSGTYDILDLNYAWFGQFIATNGLLELAPYVENPSFPKVDLKGFVPAILETYGVWEGKLYGLPWLGDAMIFCYNKAHFEAAGLDPQKAPTTWDEVYEFGKALTKDERYGFALMGGRQIQAMCTYAAIFFGLSGKDFYDASGAPQFDSDEGRQAMEIVAVKLPEIAPKAATSWDIVKAAESVAQGVTSMQIQWPGILPGLLDPNSSKVVGQMAFTNPPGGTALGGHAIAVSNYSKNKDAAYLLANYLVSPEIQREYVSQGYSITLTELFNDPAIQQVNPYIKALGDSLAIGRGWPRTEETNEVFDIMVKHISNAITKQEKPDAAVRAMNEEIFKLRKERGFIKS